MKSLIKKVLPASVIESIRTVLSKRNRPNYPIFNRYPGNDDSVLECCIAYNAFGGYCVPLSSRHRPAARKIVSSEVWEPETIEFISKHCQGGDIVHAGTYFGDFLPALSRSCDSGSTVWAFEPNPENYRCASITVLINGLRNVTLTNSGLGSQKGSFSMMISDESGRSLGGASRLIEVEHENKKHKSIKVEIVRVDDIVPPDRRVTVLQLDVEDFEQPALSGAMETIRRSKPILILEKLPETGWLTENILRLGYKIVGKVHANTILKVE